MKLYKLILLSVFLNQYYQPVKLWDLKYISNFVMTLSKYMQTQELTWFLSEQLDTEGGEHLETFMLMLHKTMGITQMVLTNRTDLRIQQTESKKNYMGLVLTTGPDDPIMTVHDKVLLGRHTYFNFIIMVHDVDEFGVVERFIYDMSSRNFQNSVLYYRCTNGSNELYGYTIFPVFKVENRKDFFAYLMKYFEKYMAGGMDVESYQFYTPLRQDVPGVFHYENAADRVELQGTAYKTLKLFFDYINGSLVNYEMPKDSLGGQVIDMNAALDLVRDGKIPLLAHAYALFEIDDEIDKSYPIMVVKWCLMVPIWNSVSTHYYPVQPFDELVWYTWVGAFVALVLTDWLRILWRASVAKTLTRLQLEQSCRESFWNNFCFVLNIAACKIIKCPSSVVHFLLYACVFFHGFFFAANYTSLLGSILTVTIFRTQINTMDDLISANVSVMIIDYELDFLLRSGDNDLPYGFFRLLRPVDVATFNSHQLTLNASYAYFVTDDKWHFLELQQKYLKQGIFKFTDICFGSYHLAFAMQPDSPIWRNLEYYLYRVHSSGMLQHFEATSFDYAVHAGLVKRLTEANEYTSAGMQHLIMIFVVLVGVFCVTWVIFVGELFCHWCLNRSSRRNGEVHFIRKRIHLDLQGT